MAAGALTALRRAGPAGARGRGGRRLRRLEHRHLADPALTTIRQPLARISAEMVRLLGDVIAGEQPAAVILPTELVRRAST